MCQVRASTQVDVLGEVDGDDDEFESLLASSSRNGSTPSRNGSTPSRNGATPTPSSDEGNLVGLESYPVGSSVGDS